MRYKLLGRSGLYVSELCLGTMTFGGGGGMWQKIGQLQQDEADALVKAALDAGINFIDTANVYADGLSEQILGQSLRNLGVARGEVVIATKVLGRMGTGPTRWKGDLRGRSARLSGRTHFPRQESGTFDIFG